MGCYLKITGHVLIPGQQGLHVLQEPHAVGQKKWMSDILLRDYNSVCNNFCCTTGNWWSGEKSWTWCAG